MNQSSFFSSNSYIFLPSKNNPKVALSIDNTKFSKNAFKLYNPFSSKAKTFKSVAEFCFTNLNSIFKPLVSAKKEQSEFISYLESELREQLVVSLYFATIKDKIVLQLQSKEAKVIGYLKYPLNNIGLKHIQNEINAFELLSSVNIIDSYLMSKNYNAKPFLLLKELDGIIDRVDRNNIDKILKNFERKELYKLIDHPRVLDIKHSLQNTNFKKYINKIETICKNSSIEYKLVYEHGDFTPWNIIKVEEKFIPFDFEYFVEDGLEYFDLIKYYYQIGKLLESKNGKELVNYISQNIDINGIKELLVLFLIKEIVRNQEENESIEFEKNILTVLETL